MEPVRARNPFHYGTPVEGEQFVGRRQELAALVSRMTDGINVVLLSPRRYGKTSLLLAAQRALARVDPPAGVVAVNVLRARDLSTLVGLLTAGVYDLPGGRWRRGGHGLSEFVRRIRLRPTVTIDDTGRPSFGFEPGLAPTDADDAIADLYALLGEVATSRPTVLILDEFQAVTDHGAHLPALLKSLADAHPRVSLIVAGSKRHVMERLVTEPAAPLYGMAQRLALGPIPAGEMVPFLVRRARAGGKALAEDVAGRVFDVAGPIPNDVQRLAYEAFEIAGDEIDGAAVAAGAAQAVAHEASTYAETYAGRPPGQRRVLVALAERSRLLAPYSQAFARSVGLAGGNSVKKAVDSLVADEMVAHGEEGLVVVDPFFAQWLRAAGE